MILFLLHVLFEGIRENVSRWSTEATYTTDKYFDPQFGIKLHGVSLHINPSEIN